jgi:hypothetical protein
VPRLTVEVDEEVIQGLEFARVYWGLTVDQTANMLLLGILAEFTERIANQLEEEDICP